MQTAAADAAGKNTSPGIQSDHAVRQNFDCDMPDLWTTSVSDNMTPPSCVADFILQELINAATFDLIKAMAITLLKCATCHAL